MKYLVTILNGSDHMNISILRVAFTGSEVRRLSPALVGVDFRAGASFAGDGGAEPAGTRLRNAGTGVPATEFLGQPGTFLLVECVWTRSWPFFHTGNAVV